MAVAAIKASGRRTPVSRRIRPARFCDHPVDWDLSERFQQGAHQVGWRGAGEEFNPGDDRVVEAVATRCELANTAQVVDEHGGVDGDVSQGPIRLGGDRGVWSGAEGGRECELWIGALVGKVGIGARRMTAAIVTPSASAMASTLCRCSSVRYTWVRVADIQRRNSAAVTEINGETALRSGPLPVPTVQTRPAVRRRGTVAPDRQRAGRGVGTSRILPSATAKGRPSCSSTALSVPWAKSKMACKTTFARPR